MKITKEKFIQLLNEYVQAVERINNQEHTPLDSITVTFASPYIIEYAESILNVRIE